MKKIYSCMAVFLACWGITTNLLAQRTEEEINKEVVLLREYNPTLNDAEKINLEPSIYAVKKANLNTSYIESTPVFKAISKNISSTRSGNFNPNITNQKQIGYLKFGAGSYGNLDGKAGVRFNASPNDVINFWIDYVGSNGNVKYLKNDLNSFLKDQIKANLSDLNIHLDYTHSFHSSSLQLGANYRNLGFNYYGNPLLTKRVGEFEGSISDLWNNFDFETKQKIDILNVNGALFSNENSSDILYKGNIDFTAFNTKYGYLPTIHKGPQGGIINGGVDVAVKLLDDYVGYLGVAGDVTFQYFDKRKEYEPTNGSFSNLFHFKANPYYKLEDSNWDIIVGMNIDYVRNYQKNKLLLSPEIRTKLHFADVNTVYLNVTGGVGNNTYVDMINENKYIALFNSVKHSHSPYNIQLGVKSGMVSGLEFEIFGGYKKVKDAHYFTNGTFSEADRDPTTKVWPNVATIDYYTALNIGHFGAKIATTLIPYTTLSASGTGYFYSTKDEIKIFNRPKFEGIIAADIKPINPLTISITYLLQTGRKGLGATLFQNYSLIEEYNMKNINEVNIGAEYQIIKPLSIFARVNNIFNQRYELQPGYTLQGINILGGFSLKF